MQICLSQSRMKKNRSLRAINYTYRKSIYQPQIVCKWARNYQNQLQDLRHQECHFLCSPLILVVQLETWPMHSSQPARTALFYPKLSAYTSCSHIPTTQGNPSPFLLQPQSFLPGGVGAEHSETFSAYACSSYSHLSSMAQEYKADLLAHTYSRSSCPTGLALVQHTLGHRWPTLAPAPAGLMKPLSTYSAHM